MAADAIQGRIRAPCPGFSRCSCAGVLERRIARDLVAAPSCVRCVCVCVVLQLAWALRKLQERRLVACRCWLSVIFYVVLAGLGPKQVANSRGVVCFLVCVCVCVAGSTACAASAIGVQSTHSVVGGLTWQVARRITGCAAFSIAATTSGFGSAGLRWVAMPRSHRSHALRLPGPMRPRWVEAARDACLAHALPVPYGMWRVFGGCSTFSGLARRHWAGRLGAAGRERARP